MERADRNERMAIDAEKMLRLMTTQKTKAAATAAVGAAAATATAAATTAAKATRG